MKRFRRTPTTATEGELLVRRMSEKAQDGYHQYEGIGVWADNRNDNEGIFAALGYDAKPVEYTFDELERAFEDLYDEMAAALAEYED